MTERQSHPKQQRPHKISKQIQLQCDQRDVKSDWENEPSLSNRLQLDLKR